MINAFVALGSNIEEPARQLAIACQMMAALEHTRLLTVSPVYESPPMGPADQPRFLNACAQLQTGLQPMGLLDHLLRIETSMGRVRRRHWGERCIDLDLLLFGNIEIKQERLTLPHPGLYKRDFVLQPLQDLLGREYVMPNGEYIGTLLAVCTTGHLIKRNIQLSGGEDYGNPP